MCFLAACFCISVTARVNNCCKACGATFGEGVGSGIGTTFGGGEGEGKDVEDKFKELADLGV